MFIRLLDLVWIVLKYFIILIIVLLVIILRLLVLAGLLNDFFYCFGGLICMCDHRRLVKVELELEAWMLDMINSTVEDDSVWESDSEVVREMVYDSVAFRGMWDDHKCVRDAYDDYVANL
jgi:hypothetical protein